MTQFEDRFPPDYFWRDGGGEFQDYYDGRYVIAGFYAPLTYTLALTNGTGSPTLTRATAMWVFDDEGKLITVPASAAAFGGSRMVRNFAASPEDMTGAQWVASNITKAAALDPVGNSGAVLLTVNSSVFSSYSQGVLQSLLGGNTRTYNGFYKPGTIEWVRMYVYDAANSTNRATAWFNLTTNAAGTSSTGGTGFTITSFGVDESEYPGWYEFYIVVELPEAAGTANWYFVPVDSDGGVGSTTIGGKTITLAWPQLENTTGRSDKTPSKYVSGDNGAGVTNLQYFATHKNGTPIPPNDLLGLATNHAAVTNTMLWCRDYTNAAWVATNVTPAKTQTGLGNASNSCSLLTATANDATILQTITASAAAGCTGFYVKRSVGTGTISITRDGGSTWTDITSLINASTFTKVKIENTSITNPSVGFKISTSGDAIIVDGGLNHLGTKIHHLPILTTSAAVTVNAQTLTYPKTSNIIDSDGTILASVTVDDWTGVDGSIVGSTTRGLFATATGASAKDGTNTPTGASDTPLGTVDIGMKYTTDFMRAMSDAGFGTATDYTGTLATDLTNISINSGVTGYVKDVAIWQEVISDYKMRNMP